MEEKDLKTEEEKGNKLQQKIVAGIVGCVGLFIIIYCICAGVFKTENNIEKLKITNTSLTYEYIEYYGYSATISGVAKNVSGRDFSYASVEFSVYDAAGNNLGTALANINNLSKGDTWNFKAILLGSPTSQPVSYKLANITTW